MSKPFAYVTYIEHDNGEHLVFVHPTLDEAENALFDYAQTVFDEGTRMEKFEIVETLACYGKYACIYAVTKDSDGSQDSLGITPFEREYLAVSEEATRSAGAPG